MSRALVSRRYLLVTGATLCVLAGALVFASAPVLAFRGHVLRGQFGAATSTPANPEPLLSPTGVAVNQTTEDVYVVDSGNRRVEQFSSTGTYLSQFNGSVGPPTGAFVSPEYIAVNNSTSSLVSKEDVYVADTSDNVIDQFTASGTYEGQLTGTCASPGTCPGSVLPFGELRGVAVDPEGNVWVYEGEGNIDEFSDAGSFVKTFNTGRGAQLGLAVDSSDSVYVTCCGENVGKFSSTGVELAEFSGGGTSALAIDPSTNNLFVDKASSIEEFGPFGEPFSSPVETFPSEGLSESHGIAVNGDTGTVYATQREAGTVDVFNEVVLPDVSTEPASGLSETGASLIGTVTPAGIQVSSCEFEYGTDVSYGQSVACEQKPAQIGAGSEPVPVSAEIAGLQPDTIYHYRLKAGNALYGTNPGQDHTFTTLGPLVVEGESSSGVGSDSATLNAAVNAGGRPSTYEFEYGTSESYGSTTPPESIGSGHATVSVLATLSELQPETVYHFRVLLTGGAGLERVEAVGQDNTFETTPVGIVGLPDDRSYEMVSPVDNADGNVYTSPLGPRLGNDESSSSPLPVQAAADGDAIAYIGDPSATGGTGKEGLAFGNQYLATRAPAGGWTAANIEPPTGNGSEEPTYQAFSSDLSVGILAWDGQSALTAGAPGGRYSVLYSRASSDGSFHPFFTTTPPNRSSKEGNRFESYDIYTPALEESLVYAGASSNLEHLLFVANDALTPEAVDRGEKENNLYDSIDGQLRLVNVLPNGTSKPNAIFGSPAERPEENPREDSPDFSHVISEDGSRIFWSSLNAEGQPDEGQPEALYVRENDAQPQSPVNAQGECEVPADACTVQVDAAEPGALGSSGGGRFWTASSDGSKVFFTDESQLTEGSTAAPGEPDLYEYRVNSETGKPGTLTDLTVGVNAGEHANVRGVVGASEDGSYVYYVTNPNGGASGGGDLDVLHEGEAPKPITGLSAEDDRLSPTLNNRVFGDWRPGLGNRTAEVSPDGHHLVFMAGESVEVYDATLPVSSGNPVGIGSGFLEPSYSNTYMRRWMSAEGTRVFFESEQAFVPQDINRKLDVYEWEQNGTGSCDRDGGCVYLLSGGTSTDNSFFADASENGDDVFLITRAQLVPQDVGNDTFNVYDARVGAPQPLSPPVCSGSGCQGVPPAPPIFATPSSVTFNGVGNFPPPAVVKPKSKSKPAKCKKGYVKKKAKCVKKPRAKKKAKKSAKGRK